jgi:hypothetical protein
VLAKKTWKGAPDRSAFAAFKTGRSDVRLMGPGIELGARYKETRLLVALSLFARRVEQPVLGTC